MSWIVAVLIDRTPQVVALTGDGDEYFVGEERIAESVVFALESLREERAKLVAPQPHRLVRHLDSTFSEQVLDVAVAEIETMVEPDRVLNDGRWESVSFVEIGRLGHAGIVAHARLT